MADAVRSLDGSHDRQEVGDKGKTPLEEIASGNMLYLTGSMAAKTKQKDRKDGGFRVDTMEFMKA